MQRSDGAGGDWGESCDRSDWYGLVLVKLAAAKGAAVFSQTVIDELAGGRVIVGEFVVANGSREGLGMKGAVGGDFGLGAPFYVVVLDWFDVARALRFLWRVRLFGGALVARLDDFFRLVAGIGKYEKSVTNFGRRKREEGRRGGRSHAFAVSVLHRNWSGAAGLDPPVSRLAWLPIKVLTRMIANWNAFIAVLAVVAKVRKQVLAVLHVADRLVG